jgi:FMN phosphatase YigB (HAD superfamily)
MVAFDPQGGWDGIRLVVFDVDGTLYRQFALRVCMMAEMAGHLVRTGDAAFVKVVKTYRELREEMGASEMQDFEDTLVARTGEQAGVPGDQVREIVADWIEHRPLRHLARCTVPGVRQLFAGLRRRGKQVAIWSDYPASGKLKALGLEADIVLASGDAGVRILKPHPRGLEWIMSAAGVGRDETLMIGDRDDRDGAAATRASVAALIRTRRSDAGFATFRTFQDPMFRAMHAA